MSSAAEILHDISPDMHFEPADELLAELYLLRRVRGQPDLFPGLIVDDDGAANTQPWELFGRHGLPIKDGARAFFFVHTNGGARPDRRCQDGGTWKSQKRLREDLAHEMVVDGEKIKWSRHNLNFHMDMESGSKGWVMHEYTITTNPSLKLCRISYSGYGHKRKRVPDGYDGDCHVAGEPATQRPRVAAEESGSATSGSGTTTATFDQGLEPLALLSDDAIAEVLDIIAQPLADGETYQQVPVMDQSSSGVLDIGDTDAVHWEGIDFTFSYDDNNSMC